MNDVSMISEKIRIDAIVERNMELHNAPDYHYRPQYCEQCGRRLVLRKHNRYGEGYIICQCLRAKRKKVWNQNRKVKHIAL